MSFLSSPRRRRRLIRGGSLALVVGAIAFSMIHWSNTGHSQDTPLSNEPAQLPAPPQKKSPFARAVKEGVLETATLFVNTAVVRDHVEDSWEIVAPSLRAGYTRETWATQDIPVQPYPVDQAKWDVDYSWEDTVGLRVALFPKRGEDVPAAVFDMVLRASGEGDERRWLVESWTPAPYIGVPSGPLGSSRNAARVVTKAPLATSWLVVPFAVLSLVLLVPLAFLVRGWLRDRRAVRRYESTLP